MIVVWRITEKCNLYCPFCAYDAGMKRSRQGADPDEILRFGALLSEYRRKTGNDVLVSWLGGEPLLWNPLPEIDEIFHHRYGLHLSTTTNGKPLASDTMREHLINYYTELTISIDGIGKIHDALRGWPGGFETVKHQVANLVKEKRRAGKGPLLRVNTVLMNGTFSHFEHLCREVAAWGVEELSFNQLGGRERPAFYPANRLLKSQTDWLANEFPLIRDRLAGLGLRLKGSRKYIDRIRASSRNNTILMTECDPGRHFIFINEKGVVAPCSFTTRECGIPVQQIRCTADLEGLAGQFAEKRKTRLPAACGNCMSNQVFGKFMEEKDETAGTGFRVADAASGGNAG